MHDNCVSYTFQKCPQQDKKSSLRVKPSYSIVTLTSVSYLGYIRDSFECLHFLGKRIIKNSDYTTMRLPRLLLNTCSVILKVMRGIHNKCSYVYMHMQPRYMHCCVIILVDIYRPYNKEYNQRHWKQFLLKILHAFAQH